MNRSNQQGGVKLTEEAFYWVKPAYGENAGQWIVAQWSVGSFWAGRGEISPTEIVGPIPPPEDAGLSALQQEGGE